MNNFAPILIPTLNRFDHFKRCVESLSVCTHADKTSLFIALDYPSNDSHLLGYEKINNYLTSIKGFKDVIIIKRKVNFGPRENIIEARNAIYEKYDRVITSEDDNEFSPNFLDYINKGLDIFEDDKNVLAICGYKFPFDVPPTFPYNYFYSKGFSGWGFGLWRDREIARYANQNTIKEVNQYLHKPWKAYQLNSYQYGLLLGLMNLVQSGKFAGDRMYCFHNLVKGTYSVFPTVSLVRNTGHDGTGVHSSKMEFCNNPFINQPIDTNNNFTFDLNNNYENKDIKEAFKNHNLKYLSLRFHHKIKLLLSYLLFLLRY